MDIQKLMDALSEASRNTRSDYHVTLGQLIELVKGTTGLVRFTDGGGPGEEMSYRGYYSDLSFGEGPPAQAAAFLEQLQKALGATYEGYKGGDYVMGPETPLWRGIYGSTGDAIVSADYEDGDLVLRCKSVA